MTPRRRFFGASSEMAAVALRAAAIGLFCTVSGAARGAGEEPGTNRALAIELRVALGDLRRIETPGLPEPNVEGLRTRLAGALGLLPWLLMRAGLENEAEALAARAGLPLEDDNRAALSSRLENLAARVPLDLAARIDVAPPGAARAEAGALHETYCAGCHDFAENGDPDIPLPARDLGLMAQEGPPEEFLARLISGVKGDETIAFRSPLTDRQILALYAYYRDTSRE